MVELTGTARPAGGPAGQLASQAPATKTTDPSKQTGSAMVDAPFRISTVQTRDRWFKGMFYGRAGVGKTELAGSAVDVPMMRDVLLVDAESGDMTLFDNERIHNLELLHHIKATDFTQIAYIQEFLQAYCIARDRGDKKQMSKLYKSVTGIDTENPPEYRTVIIDSLTEVEAYCTYQILKVDPDNVRKELAADSYEVAGWPEFRKNNEMVKLLVRAFRNLPMHVIFLCSEAYSEDEIKRKHYAPALTGKLGAQVQGFVDVVGRVMVGEVDEKTGVAPRRVFVQPIGGGPKFDAKNRRSVYSQAYFENPNMGSLMKDIGLLPKDAVVE